MKFVALLSIVALVVLAGCVEESGSTMDYSEDTNPHACVPSSYDSRSNEELMYCWNTVMATYINDGKDYICEEIRNGTYGEGIAAGSLYYECIALKAAIRGNKAICDEVGHMKYEKCLYYYTLYANDTETCINLIDYNYRMGCLKLLVDRGAVDIDFCVELNNRTADERQFVGKCTTRLYLPNPEVAICDEINERLPCGQNTCYAHNCYTYLFEQTGERELCDRIWELHGGPSGLASKQANESYEICVEQSKHML
ncbi:MAG: hypothetical protein KAW41_06325 [Candidatus Diapherotrites archaeon]|nr:hypothetical protein [Candidatus Diapherotrites archaeon]